MKATEILTAEHHVIEAVLRVLRRIVEETTQKGSLDEGAAQEAIDFFRNFADHCHHSKEEERLFPAMEAHGFPRQAGPIAVMLHEHVMGRECVKGMAESLHGAATGDPQRRSAFQQHAQAFIDLLHAHIEKENSILFRMADQALSETAKAELLEEFRRVESEAGGKRHRTYLERARGLCERYGVEFPDREALSPLYETFDLA
ncbi:MAG: hemerythrin [Deltaproteobacteria bacterium]|nr:MAG: hemerythrin [Deltaproteobacteria bacterium]